MKHLPFNSIYLPNFEVVEQRVGNFSFFPHTEQLPKLLRALNFTFHAVLPDRIARVDRRAKDLQKIEKHAAALMFCNQFNAARGDDLRLQALTDKDLVARISIVQQIIEHTPKGQLHRFKFYGGDDFFTDIYLNGKGIVFSGHAVARFFERVPNPVGTDLTCLFEVIYGSPTVAMHCDSSLAFVYDYQGSVIALPVREQEKEFIFATCLSINEINRLEPILPPPIFNLHYDPVYTEPVVRNWDVNAQVQMLLNSWQRKVPVPPPEKTEIDEMSWPEFAHKISDLTRYCGSGEDSRFLFLDNIPGPCTMRLRPGGQEKRHIILEDVKRLHPDDWERIIAEHQNGGQIINQEH